MVLLPLNTEPETPFIPTSSFHPRKKKKSGDFQRPQGVKSRQAPKRLRLFFRHAGAGEAQQARQPDSQAATWSV
jgi:hypothetical protein